MRSLIVIAIALTCVVIVCGCSTFQNTRVPASSAQSQPNSLRPRIVDYAISLRGSPYVWNQAGPRAFDCSGFVYFVLKQMLGEERFALPYLTAQSYRDILNSRHAQIACETADEADIVFFPKSAKEHYNHIGLITNPDQKLFITAQAPGLGVTYGSFAPGQYFADHSPECYRNVWVE